MSASSDNDDFTWIGSSGGVWTLVANWKDVTSGADPSTSVPGSTNAVTIAGPTGSTYEVIGGGGASASLALTGLIDLLGNYSTGTLTQGSVASSSGSASSFSFTSGSLTLGAGSQVSASSADVIAGSTTVSGSGAKLSVSGALVVGSPGLFNALNCLPAGEAG